MCHPQKTVLNKVIFHRVLSWLIQTFIVTKVTNLSIAWMCHLRLSFLLHIYVLRRFLLFQNLVKVENDYTRWWLEIDNIFRSIWFNCMLLDWKTVSRQVFGEWVCMMGKIEMRLIIYFLLSAER